MGTILSRCAWRKYKDLTRFRRRGTSSQPQVGGSRISIQTYQKMNHSVAKSLVVLGTGFGAFSLLRKLNTSLYTVTVVSPRNHFLFTPLLPSTTVGTIEFRSIIEPIRKRHASMRYYQASCESVDPGRSCIKCIGELDRNRFELPYDFLVIAVGASVSTYGIPGVREHALFLKELSDSREIRQRIIECFERAAQPNIPVEERKRLLSFVVVGGGPNGVEFAAELHDFLAEDLKRIYPFLFDDVRIVLLEAGGEILTTFDRSLSDYTTKHFKRQNIDVRTGSMVVGVERDDIRLKDGSTIPFGLVVWSTGVGMSDFVRSLPFEKDRSSRILVDPYLKVRKQENIFALGDCAAIEDLNLPSTAQVAQQEGLYLGKALNRIACGERPVPFEYKDLGMLAYIGGRRALADLSAVKGKGFSSFLFWRSAYITRLVSMRNKILVVFDWMKTLLFGRDVSRF